MRKIIDDKLYDTEKCTKILDYKTKIEHKTIFGSIFKYHIASIFKTNKGTYLKYVGKTEEDNIYYDDYKTLEIISKDDFKKLLLEINDVDTYLKEFEEVEEG